MTLPLTLKPAPTTPAAALERPTLDDIIEALRNRRLAFDPAPADPLRLLTIADILDMFQIDRRTFERMRASGRFVKPVLVFGRSPRWRRSDIDRWIERGGVR